MYIISLPGELSSIQINVSAYKEGNIILNFQTSILPKLNNIYSQLKEIDISAFSKLGSTIFCRNFANIRPIIEKLKSFGLIPETAMPEIGSFLQFTDKILAERNKLTYEVEPIQKEVLNSLYEPWLDDILEKCQDYVTAIKLVRSCFFCAPLNIIELKKFLNEKTINETVLESMQGLWRICNGEANMESTFIRMSANHLPTLQAQRIEIYTNCLKKLNEKFPNLDDLQKLYMVLGLHLYIHHSQKYPPLNNTNMVIDGALTETNATMSHRTSIIFSFLSLTHINSALLDAGILGNLERMKALQKRTDSIYLKNLILQMQSQQQKNIFLQALETNDLEKVDFALASRADVEQYFPCSRTPLIFAIQQCSEEMVKLILEYKPDLHRPNMTNIYTPIATAISLAKLNIVKLLLDAGVNIFKYCEYNVQEPPPYIDSPPMFSKGIGLNPFMHALNEYKKNREPERLEILRLLLQNGAGIGSHFEYILQEYPYPEIVGSLKQIVILGGSCPSIQNVDFIQSSTEFIEKIDQKDYPKWEKILIQVLDSNFFIKNGRVYNQIAVTLNYIKQVKTNSFNPNNNNINIKTENNTTQLIRPPSQTLTPKDVNTNNNNTIRITSTQINSPIHAARVAHDNLLDDIEPIINTHPESFKPFHDSIMARNYTQALRRACTSKHPSAFDLIKTLCAYKNKLNFDINEPNREQKYTALHYAALNQNPEIYDYLISIGANPNVKADVNKASGKTPAEIREETKLAGEFTEKLNVKN